MSLCLSMLDMHSDVTECGRVLLELCEYLSSFLRRVPPGVKNPEVDYNFVVRCQFSWLNQHSASILLGVSMTGIIPNDDVVTSVTVYDDVTQNDEANSGKYEAQVQWRQRRC